MYCMSASHQHHFVSVWLLRNFTDNNGYLWWWSKDLAPGCVLRQKPEVVFRRGHLNARVLSDGTLDQGVENAMTELDSKIAPIVRELLDQGRNDQSPSLTIYQRNLLIYFLFVQFKRSPEWRTKTMESQVYEDLESDELPNDVPPRIGANIASSAADHVRNILQNDFAESLLLGDSEVQEVLGKKGLVLCRAPHTTPLIIGTTGVVSAGAGSGSLHESHRGLALPMASDMLLLVGKSRDVRETCDLSAEQVNTINKQIAGHCHGIAGRSEELVRSLVPSR